MRGEGRAALVLFTVLLFASLVATIPTSAQEPGVGVMQSEDARNLTHEQNVMYLYGNSNEERQETWPMWTHSATSDVESDDTVGEGNVGGTNSGGGTREFVWDGSNPPAEPVPIDTSVPITGAIKLQLICNWEQDQCSKQVDIVLRLGSKDIAHVSIDTPDEDDYYYFEFHHQIEEVPAGETFGIRLSFQKPGNVGDGYNLDLGRDNSWMDIPVLPSYQETIPGLDNPDGYESPYSQASGFRSEAANSTSIFGLIFWGVLGIGVFVGGFMYLPPIPFKELTILFTGLGLLVSMLVAPLVAGPLATGMAANPDDPDVWTIEELAQLEERDGTFLGDALVAGYSFTLYAEYDQVYVTKDGAETISGLGYESDAYILGDLDISRRGREYVQLFFSLYHVDLRPGQAIMAEITIINTTDPATGQDVILPMYADPNGSPQIVTVTVDGQDSIRYGIPHEVCTLIGEDSTWGMYAHISTLVGLLLGGIGFWMAFRGVASTDEVDEELEEEDDWDEEDELVELEDI